MNSTTRVGLLLAATMLVGLVVGCTTTSVGEPRPGDTVTETSDEPDQPSSSEKLPERPREIKLDGIDPCTLIPEADYPDFYMEKPGKPETDESSGSPECVWLGTEVGYFGIILDKTAGIDVWLDGSRAVEGEPVDPIEGFAAVTYGLPNDDNACFVAIDVAEGQSLVVQVGLDSSRPTDLPPICEYTHQFAASAMSTLVES